MANIDKKVFRTPSVYISDRGLSRSDQNVPVLVTDVDSSWMKASIIENKRSGLIVGAETHQSFVPYQTQFETKQVNTWGVIKQDDRQTPWVDYTVDQWYDSVNFPPDIRGIHDIKGWYSQKLKTSKELYQWKTDIFGNQYGLYKDLGTPNSPKTLYNKKHSYGEFWVCNSTGGVSPASAALSAVFNNHVTMNQVMTVNNFTNSNFKDLDVFYDVIMMVTPTEVTLDKILFDYDTGTISSLPDYSHMMDLSADQGGKFADVWLFEEVKKVVLCSVVPNVSGVPLPYIYEIDLETDQFDLRFPLSNSDLTQLQSLSAQSFTSIDYPTFTYNSATKKYVISLNATNQTLTMLILITMSSRLGAFQIENVTIYYPGSIDPTIPLLPLIT